MDLAGQRFTVMGLGRHGGGVAVARCLAQHGARVTVTDQADAAALAESVAELADVPIAGWTLGRHEALDFEAADAIVVNPAVRPNHPLLQVAQARGIRITSEIELFLDECAAPAIGVTGSNGKSTTATMLAGLFAAAGRRAWLGGNIGISLLPELERIKVHDIVVLELSSFQLAHLSDDARFPTAAVITHCTANHLDWHGSFAAYAAAKRRLVERLRPDGFAVLNSADPLVASWASSTRARIVPPWPLERVPELAVVGHHNRSNAACAAAAAEALRVPVDAIEYGLRGFGGLAHRCQLVGEVDGRRFIDDSKSTTPEGTLAALASIPGRVWLLLGGQDKGADFGPLLTEIGRRAGGVAFFGSAGPMLHSAFARLAPDTRMCTHATPDLRTAFRWCWEQSAAGDTILLSPGCASLDQFRDFEHRAEAFVALMNEQK